jgi:hypothetical protein
MLGAHRSLLVLDIDVRLPNAEVGATFAAGLRNNHALEQLYLHGQMTIQPWRDILNALQQGRRLRVLHVDFSHDTARTILSQTMAELVALLRTNLQLCSLGINHSELHGGPLRQLVDVITAHPKLRMGCITLRDNRFNDKDAKVLARLLSMPALQVLCLEGNEFGAKGKSLLRSGESLQVFLDWNDSAASRKYEFEEEDEEYPAHTNGKLSAGSGGGDSDRPLNLAGGEQPGCAAASVDRSVTADEQSITEPQPVSPIGLPVPSRRLQPSDQGQAEAEAEAELSANDNDSVTEPCVPTKEEMQAMTLAAAIRRAAASSASSNVARAAVAEQELGVPGVPWDAAVHGAEPCGTNTTPVVANAPSSVRLQTSFVSPAAVLSPQTTSFGGGGSAELLVEMRAEMAALREKLQQEMEECLCTQARQFEAKLAARRQQ